MGSIGNFFSGIGRDIDREHGAGFLLGAIGFIPQVNSWTFQNRYYIGAAAVTVATYGVGSGLAAGGWGAAVANGAFAGEVVTGVSSGLSGASPQATFRNTLIGGAEGALSAGAAHGAEAIFPVSGGGWDALGQIGAKAAIGGGLSATEGGNFVRGLAIAGAAATLNVGYQDFVGYGPEAGPGQQIPGGAYQGAAPQGMNVIGLNEGGGGFFDQGGPLSNSLNNVPGVNAIAATHDDIFNYNLLPFNALTNLGTIPAAVGFTGGALVGGPWSQVGIWASTRR